MGVWGKGGKRRGSGEGRGEGRGWGAGQNCSFASNLGLGPHHHHQFLLKITVTSRTFPVTLKQRSLDILDTYQHCHVVVRKIRLKK